MSPFGSISLDARGCTMRVPAKSLGITRIKAANEPAGYWRGHHPEIAADFPKPQLSELGGPRLGPRPGQGVIVVHLPEDLTPYI